MSEDFYSLLGVNQNSSTAEIKKSYKQLARKYHPDNSSTGNEEMFKKIGEAYAVLSDSQKKSVYDQVGHEAFVNGGSRAGAGGFGGGSFFSDFGDMDDIMSTFFGGSFGGGRSSQRNRRQRGGDVQVTTDLTFMEAVKGKTQEIKFNRLTECKTCDGSGADPAVGVKTCETCNGMGEVKRTTQSFLGMVTQISTCPT
ncbi:MAG TPA: DnaJ domain-containing protein, partial [Vampirovibrionales bacterium]